MNGTDQITCSLGLLDFREAFHIAPAQAVKDLEDLLCCELACRQRIAFLQALAASSPERTIDSQSDWQSVMDLACDHGLMRAFREGSLNEEYVDALHRLSCNPRALWQTHCRLMQPGDAAAAEQQTAQPGETSA